MRYLKVIAQDRSGHQAADTLQFLFFDGDQLLGEATLADRQRLRVLGKTYLKCAWSNVGSSDARHLRIFAENPSANGSSELVRLHFHDGPQIAYKAAARDLDNDGELELILSSDVDNDGHANRTDRARVRTMAKEFLRLGWK